MKKTRRNSHKEAQRTKQKGPLELYPGARGARPALWRPEFCRKLSSQRAALRAQPHYLSDSDRHDAGFRTPSPAQSPSGSSGFSFCAFLCLFVAIFFLLQLAPLSAASALAMRVDVQPTAIVADGTVMTVEVQLAPSDRGRIGRQARMRVKLTQGTKTTAHILQDVDFDDQGMTRMEYTWPPGSYELSLTVESLRGTAQGLWVGHVDVPESLDQPPTSAPPEPKVETPRAETGAPAATPLPEAGAAALAAAPVVATAGPQPKSPATATEKAAVTAPPKPAPILPTETIPPTPEPSVPTLAADPSPMATPAAEPTPIPQAKDEVPPPQPVAAKTPKASGPVYALILDIDPSDIEIADRTASLRASINRRAENVTPIIIQAGDSDPTLAVRRALDILRPHPESKAIVVITDVRRKASRSEWKKTAASVQSAEIPIFVIGLWNDEFDPGTRKQFKRLATDSGGRSYLLQPSESPARALEMLDSALNEHP